MMQSLSMKRVFQHLLHWAVALTAVLAVAGCATPDNRTALERANDEAIARRVQAALTAQTYLDSDHVTVEVTRGVVRLSGLVGDAEDLAGVLRVSNAVPGVLGIDDQLEIMDFTDDSGGAEGHIR